MAYLPSLFEMPSDGPQYVYDFLMRHALVYRAKHTFPQILWRGVKRVQDSSPSPQLGTSLALPLTL